MPDASLHQRRRVAPHSAVSPSKAPETGSEIGTLGEVIVHRPGLQAARDVNLAGLHADAGT